jgi:stage II sporulation protein E
MQKWVGLAGVSALKNLELAFAKPALSKAAILLARFVLGFCFSQAVIFEKYAPFGLGFAAAGSSASAGFPGFLGALVGYFFAPDGVDGLKYIAAAVLIFAALLIFRDTRAFKSQFFMPACAAAAACCVNVVFLAESGFPVSETILYSAEIVLAFGSAYFYKFAFGAVPSGTQTDAPVRSIRRVVGLLAASSTLLIPLARVVLPLGISAGRIVAAAAVLTAAYCGGAGAGSAAGVCAGLAIDTVSGQPLFSMAYGFSGLISGIASGARRITCVICYTAAVAAAALLSGSPTLWQPLLLETAAAGIFFMLTPNSLHDRLRESFGEGSKLSAGRAVRACSQAGKKLEQAAQAFKDLYDTLSATFDSLSKANDEEIASVFDRASGRVCRSSHPKARWCDT